MNKAIIIIGCMSIALNACKTNPEKIKLSELKSACDYISAEESILDELIMIHKEHPEIRMYSQVYARKVGDPEPIKNEFSEKFEILYQKLNYIDNAASLKFTTPEINECDKLTAVRKKWKEI